MHRFALLITAACTTPQLEPLPAAPGTPDVLPDPFLDAVIDGDPREFRVDVSASAADQLRVEPREWVPCEVRFRGDRLDAEVRLKGNGSFEPFDERPSLKVRFDHSFHGRRTLILNNGRSDPTRMKERLANEAYRMSGVPAPRTGSVWVRLAGSERGLYTVLEDVDGRLMGQWFDSGDGALYEVFDGDFTDDLIAGIEHEDGPEAPELLANVTQALALGDVVGVDAATEFVDRDAFLRFLAVTAAVAQTDAYPYSDPGDDVYLYANPDTGKLHFVPHGLDEAFEPRDLTLNRVNGLLARRCMVDPTCREELAAHLVEVFDVLEGPWEDERARVAGLAVDWVADPRWIGFPLIIDIDEWAETRRAQLAIELQEFADLQ